MGKLFRFFIVALVTVFVLFLALPAAGAEHHQKTNRLTEEGPIVCPATTKTESSASLDAILAKLQSCTIPRKHRWMIWERRRPAIQVRRIRKDRKRADGFVGSFFYPHAVIGCTIRKHPIS